MTESYLVAGSFYEGLQRTVRIFYTFELMKKIKRGLFSIILL